MGSMMCGIKALNDVRFVKVGGRKTKARSVVRENYGVFVLLENGTVATNDPLGRNACFLVNCAHGFSSVRGPVEALYKLGVISQDTLDEFRKKDQELSVKHQLESDANFFKKTAAELGITLTAAQKRKLKSKAHFTQLSKKGVNP